MSVPTLCKALNAFSEKIFHRRLLGLMMPTQNQQDHKTRATYSKNV